MAATRTDSQNCKTSPVAHALKSAALLLPGLLSSTAHGQDTLAENVSIQYSRYMEGERDLISVRSNLDPLSIEVFHATTSLQLTGRLGFSLSYTQDTWAGATPATTAPLVGDPNRAILVNTPGGVVSAGASPFAVNPVLLNQQRIPLRDNGQGNLNQDPRSVLVMASASPESRDQLSVNFNYDWNRAALNIGTGYSFENDYESVFLNALGSIEFNQGATTLSFGTAYADNEISAELDPDFTPYLTTTSFADQIKRIDDSSVLFESNHEISINAGLTQIIDQESLLDFGVGMSRSDGYLGNPYKATTVLFIDPDTASSAPDVPILADGRALMEQRPGRHDQFTFRGKYVNYISSLDAALHVTLNASTDDWGIDSRALTLELVQPLFESWMLTPRIRYYTQDSADFYQSYLISEQAFRKRAEDALGREVWFDVNEPEVNYFLNANGDFEDADQMVVDAINLDLLPKLIPFDANQLPESFSSDHRLSSFGSLSAGLTLSKSWRNGISFEAGVEYYDRKSNLAWNNDGNSDFADFDFWVANAALSIDLAPPSRRVSNQMELGSMSSGSSMRGMGALPAGVMFAEIMDDPGTWMFGYQFAFSRRSRTLLAGSSSVDDATIVDKGCPGTDGCRFVPTYMNMKMHMLNIMYAPSSRLTLMLMPQFMDMDMDLRDLAGRPPPVFETHEHSGIYGHTSGGISDATVAALYRLYDDATHHIHGGMGVSIPLGSVDEELRRTFRNDGGLIHFGMQLGSGTWDLLPNLTYTGNANRWNWGAQLSGVHRLENQNESGYSLGDVYQLTTWAGINISERINASLRYVYTEMDSIEGDFNRYNSRIGPMDFPANQGGTYQDIGLGIGYHFGGRLMGNMLSLEWMQPLRDRVNGFQRERDGSLAARWHYSF